ncbi:MAG: Fic family protein [Tannerella sp.]|jgi:Fic family protein|nr:Fic family protein [Tannerella sp.]
MNMLLKYLTDEKQSKRKGGLYHKTQVNLAYNSNRIEGSRLTEEQTRYIFETRTIGFKDEEAVPVDDIIETSNHFVAFDFLLDTVEKPLTNDIIKEFHRILKTGTSDATKPWFSVGDWKKLANEVSGAETVKPEEVENEMNKLNDWYNDTIRHCIPRYDTGSHPQSPDLFATIIEYHYRFEKIHPFQDGNGRVGRLIMFRECLRNGVVPFIIDERRQQFYYRGLKEFTTVRGYLLDTCLSAQDVYIEWIKYFYKEF